MLNKITDGDLAGKGVIGLPDVPGLPTEEMQAKFEETAREVIVPKFNGLVNQLASSTAASELGAIDPTTKGAAKVQDALNSLNEKMSNIKVEGYAPERHASVDDKYGAGSNVAYGHVKLSDEVVSNVSDDDGTAATPRAVWLATRDVVRYSAQGAMGYTEDQKAEARRNIGAAKQEELVSVFELATRAGQTAIGAQDSVDALALESVKTVYQSLTEVQKRQARENIGAAAVGGPDKSVLYEAQELDINQKAQARANIGAPAESHSDTTDKYGAASRLRYGHVKIQDEINTSATSGVAASPEGVAGAIESAKKELAPKDHSSSGIGYGAGNGTLYGHVKLSDSTYSSSSMTDGVAATPKAVSLVKEAADEAQKTARDAQEAAVGSVKYEAQSLSSEQKSQARVNIGAGSEADVNTALEKSAKAATDADAAKILANTARAEAQTALGDAALAITTANSAIGNVSGLRNTLNEVNARVTAVKATAETAQSVATEAAATAGNAEKKSDSAIVSANEAKNSAESALVSAGRAESAAGEAKNTADEAKAKAEAANITEYKSLAQEQRNAARANISAVSYEADQGLNDFARYNARTNIKAVSYEQAPQTSLTDEEKAQARKNIGAVSAEEVAPVYAVQYVDQVLTDSQKEKARANIGVPPVSHATPDDRYGAANFSQYGHVRLLNNAHSGYADDSGYAVTPYALWKETKDAVSFGSQTLTDAQKTQARANIGAAAVGEGGGWVQPDWEAAEGADGHIKNRTHWKDWEYVEVVPIKDVHLQNVGTVPYGVDTTTGAYANVVEGSKVSVYWDGKWYNCTAFVSGGSVSIGNYSVISSTAANTGEPFFLQKASADRMRFYPKIRYDSYSYGLKLAEPVYHKLPKEYLPDDIGGGATPDWNAAEGEPGHVLNRTHWSDGVETVEILPTCTPMYDDDGGMFVLADAPALEVGKNYTVNYNGTEYTCVGLDATPMGEPGVYVGDLYTATGGQVGTAPTGEPFVILSGNAEGVQVMAILDLTGATELTLSISETWENIHKLDNKYLDLDWIPKAGKPVFNGAITNTDTSQLSGESFYVFSLTAGESSALIVEGNVYEVVLDGMKYTCKGTARQELTGSVLLGNLGLLSLPDVGNTGEPFLMVSAVNSNDFQVTSSYFSDPDADEQTISLSITDGSGVKKLPGEFLPDSVPLLFNVPFTIDLVGQEATCDLSFDEVYAKASNFNTITRCVAQMSGADQVAFGALASIGSDELSFSVATGVDSSTAQIFTIIMHSDDTCSLVITRV